nr:hypothetical protein [Burkholderia ubonensis]
MNEVIEHVDARSNPVQAVDETGRQHEEHEREQHEKQIAHKVHRYFFPISVAMRESIPFRLDQRMEQIDEERDRNARRNPQHRFPLLFCLPGKPAALVDIAGPRRCGGASGRTTATPRSTGEWDATV